MIHANAASLSRHDRVARTEEAIALAALADHATEARDLAPESDPLDRVRELLHELPVVEGLGQEAVGTSLHRFDRGVDRAVRSEDDDAQPRRAALDFLEQADAIHLVHAQVGDHEIGTHAAERRERSSRALDCVDFVVFCAQTDREQPQQPRIVVND